MADEVAAAPLEQEKWADAWDADGMLCPDEDGLPRQQPLEFEKKYAQFWRYFRLLKKQAEDAGQHHPESVWDCIFGICT